MITFAMIIISIMIIIKKKKKLCCHEEHEYTGDHNNEMCRLSLSEQEKVIMDEYNLGWAARAERVRIYQ
jgi:hypothetical protein